MKNTNMEIAQKVTMSCYRYHLLPVIVFYPSLEFDDLYTPANTVNYHALLKTKAAHLNNRHLGAL